MTSWATQVSTTAGTVEGFVRSGVRRWRAIPYAKPPVGPLRFRAPEPAAPWRGVRYCREWGHCAPQDPRYTLLGPNTRQSMSEDCLTLNVVSPERAENLPVMVFIHGGGYMFGSSATPLYDGAALARRGCVYVSVNYRLGPLGCLDLTSLSPERFESNLFLRDLVLALQWVRDNIGGFGGDPANVTIFGESAGAHAVTSLLAVPAADGLFRQAIAQSPPGGMIRPSDEAAETAQRFVETLQLGGEDPVEAVLTARPSRLVRALERLMVRTVRERPWSFTVGPTIDGDYLPAHPVDAMLAGTAARVPLIVGHNAEESRLFSRFTSYLPTNEPVIERLLAADPQLRERVARAYPGYPRTAACRQFGDDFTFGAVAWRLADAHSRHAPAYLYRYDFAPRTLRWAGLGATHATELLAVFDTYRSRIGPLLTVAGDRRAALRVSEDMQRRWLEFARAGVPGRHWPQHRADQRAVRIFDRRSRVEVDPTADRRELWEALDFSRSR
ncbi:carboxylesterase/lipase family protein [Mycobacterium sp. MYCO198283]|uniref:carboxylesterase/lipase family protein n=1 Tax=Mycobacterium sp. MYCO198283 TaxID=2883505 RepID=UPI001E4EF7D3|nr:carboxylesterase/lipase family protein [Mycobacterium sp. MYCO198283]MCG5433956.1 carboxylesterase/lipase family protein [Mycobacterium sp. MYCO198283]